MTTAIQEILWEIKLSNHGSNNNHNKGGRKQRIKRKSGGRKDMWENRDYNS